MIREVSAAGESSAIWEEAERAIMQRAWWKELGVHEGRPQELGESHQQRVNSAPKRAWQWRRERKGKRQGAQRHGGRRRAGHSAALGGPFLQCVAQLEHHHCSLGADAAGQVFLGIVRRRPFASSCVCSRAAFRRRGARAEGSSGHGARIPLSLWQNNALAVEVLESVEAYNEQRRPKQRSERHVVARQGLADTPRTLGPERTGPRALEDPARLLMAHHAAPSRMRRSAAGVGILGSAGPYSNFPTRRP
ncbi:hypothetical protein NA57DRAFT_60382 [Rhizodiscina lignyota]|uniref:Uncharacterized protein n=1 Tax=Rhizodiscina lignyota TaxID=1504668 RepID=A0A9P4I4H9_9PEZI|nr:hypothetical protein NA57DRAFT_60382 [Rhizodiscina lignyota]